MATTTKPPERLDALVAILDVLVSMPKRDAKAVLEVLKTMQTWDTLDLLFDWPKPKPKPKRVELVDDDDDDELDEADPGGES